MSYELQALTFLVQVAFGLYILAVLLRLLMQWARADFRNPVARLVLRVTDPLVVPLRRVVPGIAGIDLATVLLALALQALELVVLGLLLGRVPGPAGLAVGSLAALAGFVIQIYTVTIIVEAVLSWVAPGAGHPIAWLLTQLNAPVLRPFRRLVPSVGGIDLSPLAALIVLQLVQILVVQRLADWGRLLG